MQHETLRVLKSAKHFLNQGCKNIEPVLMHFFTSFFYPACQVPVSHFDFYDRNKAVIEQAQLYYNLNIRV